MARPLLGEVCAGVVDRGLDDGNVVTGRGVLPVIELGLHLVESFVGRESREPTRWQMDYWGRRRPDKSARKCKRGGFDLTHHNGTSGDPASVFAGALSTRDTASAQK